MRSRVHYYIYIIAALLCVSCSFESVVEDITPTVPDSDDPIAIFGMSEAAMTRASSMPSNMLRTDFVVSAFKHYGATDFSAKSHTVMPRYLVQYKENRDDWNGVVSSNWNYIDIINPWTTNRQEEKFWDYSGFPYRFYAVAPANGNGIGSNNGDIIKGHFQKLDNTELFINAPFKAQSFTAPYVPPSGSATLVLTPSNKESEPYLLAQVSRNPNGEDLDIIKGKAINTESSTKSRRVWLPFHHLNSKVRFAIYTDNLAQTDRVDYIKDLTIWAERLATVATGYHAYGRDAWSINTGFSYFSGITVKDSVELINFNCIPDDGTSDRSYDQNNLSLHQSKSSAYFLECPDGIMQLPQNNVKLHITMKVVGNDGKVTAHFYDYEITKDVGSAIDPTHWQAGCIHTYYIHLQFDDLMLPIITTTCTLTPWEDISGSLSTDLEQ